MIEARQIKQMSRIEQIQVMEILWRELSANAESLHSPSWHKQLLDATEKRYLAGEEKTVDWNTAKSELRKRCQ